MAAEIKSPHSYLQEKELHWSDPNSPTDSNPAQDETKAAIQPEVQENGHLDLERNGEDAKHSEKALEPPAFDPRQNPDGGRQAWLCLVGGWCVLFCSFGWINCTGVFQEYYQSHQLREYSPATVAWIPSLEIFMMFFLGPWVGAIFDRYGFRHLLIVGTFLHVFGLMMTSLSTEYYQFILSQGICSPIGVCMIFFPAQGTLTTWFFKKRAFAFGIIASGSSIGGVVLPIMVQHLITQVGFAWSMRITAFLFLALMIIANLTISSRLPPVKKPFHLIEFLHPLTELPFDLLSLGSFLFFLGLFIPINYSIAEPLAHGMSPRLAQYMLSILNAASFFGRVLPGYFADKLGRFNVLVLTCFLSALLTLALWLPATANAPIILFNALYGFASGAFVSLAPSCIAQITPNVRTIGTRTGTYFALLSLAALVSNPIGGALIDSWDGRYTGLQIFAGVMMLGGGAWILMARVKLAGIALGAKV